MNAVENFLTPDEEQQIIAAIRRAEKTTSGEIRIHIEKSTLLDPLERAYEVFHWLKMDNTLLRNGVLIYIAVTNHTFAIYGDKGIYEIVPKDFWDNTKSNIQKHFRNGNFTQGLIDGILQAGEQLQKHFPWKHYDKNELTDEISKGT